MRSYIPEYFGSSLRFFVFLLSPRILLVKNLLVLCTQHLSVSYLCIRRRYRSLDHLPYHPHIHRISRFPIARIRRLCLHRRSNPATSRVFNQKNMAPRQLPYCRIICTLCGKRIRCKANLEVHYQSYHPTAFRPGGNIGSGDIIERLGTDATIRSRKNCCLDSAANGCATDRECCQDTFQQMNRSSLPTLLQSRLRSTMSRFILPESSTTMWLKVQRLVGYWELQKASTTSIESMARIGIRGTHLQMHTITSRLERLVHKKNPG